jgi:hypothetical protein
MMVGLAAPEVFAAWYGLEEPRSIVHNGYMSERTRSGHGGWPQRGVQAITRRHESPAGRALQGLPEETRVYEQENNLGPVVKWPDGYSGTASLASHGVNERLPDDTQHRCNRNSADQLSYKPGYPTSPTVHVGCL